MALAENLSVFLADFGINATYNGDTALVLLDQPDEDVLHGRAQSTTYHMTYNPADFPDLAHGESLTIDGVNYMVHVVDRLDDGAFRRAVIYRTTSSP